VLKEEEIRKEFLANIKERNKKFPDVKIITDREYEERVRNGLSVLFFTKLSDFYERNAEHFSNVWQRDEDGRPVKIIFNPKKAARELRVGIGPGAVKNPLVKNQDSRERYGRTNFKKNS
jgi:hypothetical protein